MGSANQLWFLRVLGEMALEEYDLCITRMLSAIDREWNAFIAEVEARAKLLGEEIDREDDHDAYIAHSLTSRFPALLAHSTFLSLYGYFESYLFDVCDAVQRAKQLNEGHYSASGTGIERAKRYLKRKCSLPFPADTTEWQELTGFNALRNVFAHRWGKIKNYDPDDPSNDSEETQKIKHLAGRIAGITIEWNGEVVVTADFCRGVVKTMQRFLALMFDGFPADRLVPDPAPAPETSSPPAPQSTGTAAPAP